MVPPIIRHIFEAGRDTNPSIKNGRWYERGLLHPFYDYDAVPEYLNTRADAMDDAGFIHLPQIPGLGEDINFDYIDANLVAE